MKARDTEAASRILEAAGAVFAERGYEGTTIREITARAKANVAAVNYYFGDKDRLYGRVLAEACVASKIDIDSLPGRPAARLEAFIFKFVHHLLNPGRPAWHGQVMAMEMAKPSPALDRVVKETIEPLCASLRHLLKELAGPGFTPLEIEMMSASVIGQCLYYVQKGALIPRIYPHLHRVADPAAHIARHVASFTQAGLEGLKKEKKPARKPAGAKS